MSRILQKLLLDYWDKIAETDAERIASQTPPGGVAVQAHIPYQPRGGPMQVLNLYLPEDAEGALPVIINVHGGGWVYGDVDLNRYYCMALSGEGFAVMGMGYRLLPHTDLRGQVQDIFAAMHWLAQNAPPHFDLGRVYLCGDSAGGHLAALAACIQQSPKLQALYGVRGLPWRFRAMGILHGMCDVKKLGLIPWPAGALVDREMHRLLFGPRRGHSLLAHHASFSDISAGLPLPPAFLVTCEGDDLQGHTLRLAETLAKRGAAYELKNWTLAEGPELTHVFEVAWPLWPESVATNKAMLEYFLRY